LGHGLLTHLFHQNIAQLEGEIGLTGVGAEIVDESGKFGWVFCDAFRF
jgi:hypothetical protein